MTDTDVADIRNNIFRIRLAVEDIKKILLDSTAIKVDGKPIEGGKELLNG